MGFGQHVRFNMVIIHQGHPMFLLIEVVTGGMQNQRENHGRQKEKREESRQKRGQEGKPKQFAMPESNDDGGLENLPALFEFCNHRV
jgi:hypothetical protein